MYKQAEALQLALRQPAYLIYVLHRSNVLCIWMFRGVPYFACYNPQDGDLQC